MRDLSSLLFDIGFYPLVHESVKHDFLGWYHEGSKSEYVDENLQVETSRLSQLALNAGVAAENFNENNELHQLTQIFEEWKSKVETYITYVALFAFLAGGGISATGVFQMKNVFFSMILQFIGGTLLVGSVGIVVIYRIIAHQIKTSSVLVTKFNRELVEKPGEIRYNDQEWNLLASQFLWNKSLLSPSTHICLILLSIIRVCSTRFYGHIAADLREEIQEFVGMNRREIIWRQIQRVRDGQVPSQQ